MIDMISRQSAIDAITDELDKIDHVPQWVFDRLENRIKQLPPAELSTNLAEVGTDCISRRSAIDALCDMPCKYDEDGYALIYRCDAADRINVLPTIQPVIIRCKDCKHYRHGLCMKASMCVNKSENGFCDWAERREVNHE